MSEEKHGLARTLDQLVKRAEEHPGQAQRQPLAHGLRVDVMVKDGQTYLQISRDSTWPSAREWGTVTRDFPSPVPNVAAKRIHDGHRYYLKAQWATVHADALPLTPNPSPNGRGEEGQGVVEYALLLALVTITVLVILALVGPAVGNVFSNLYVGI